MSDTPTALRAALADRYAIDRPLGEGGMATVYLAEDVKHRRPVAVKVLKAELAAAIGPERFLREIEIAARLSHPLIVPLYDSGDAGGFLYYVMPFIEGDSLRDRLDREGQLPLDDALEIARDVANALAHAHSYGVVHRDIKPENIMLSGEHAMVADFGIARAVDEAAEARLTQTGIAIGTPAYMSPEQALGEATVDGRSDLYSLGCVLYEALAGEPPYSGPTARAILARRLTDPLPSLRAVRESVTPALERTIGKLMAKAPADRFATARQFIDVLSRRDEVAQTDTGGAVIVLDFQNLSRDASVDWLCSGIAETVTVDLAKIAAIRVLPRQSVARALAARADDRMDDRDILALGVSLGARWVVSGSFQKAGERLRITTQFHDAERGELVGAAKLDGAMDDVFALQDEVVTRLTGTLRVELTTDEQGKIEKPETSALEAYEHYAKGRRLFHQFGERAFREAGKYFHRAIALDPDYALALSGLGSLAVFRFIATTNREELETGIEHLQRAIELDQDLAEPYPWLAYAYTRAGQLAEAEQMALRAVQLDPDNVLGYYFLAVSRHIRGEKERRWELSVQAGSDYLQAIALEPAYLQSYSGLAWLYMVNGQHDAARVLLERAMAIEAEGTTKNVLIAGAARLLRGMLHLREGAACVAQESLNETLAFLASTDHLYTAVFTGIAHCALGEAAFRLRESDEAVTHFARALDTVQRHPDHIGTGFLFVRAHLGLAKAFLDLDVRRDSRRHFETALHAFDRQADLDFSWGWECSELQAHYDFASYYAAAGQWNDAVAALERAVAAGWGEQQALEHDRSFAQRRDHPGLDHLLEAASQRSPIPTEE